MTTEEDYAAGWRATGALHRTACRLPPPESPRYTKSVVKLARELLAWQPRTTPEILAVVTNTTGAPAARVLRQLERYKERGEFVIRDGKWAIDPAYREWNTWTGESGRALPQIELGFKERPEWDHREDDE